MALEGSLTAVITGRVLGDPFAKAHSQRLFGRVPINAGPAHREAAHVLVVAKDICIA